MKKIKIGVFGAHRGMRMVEQVLARDDAELVAVCDKYRPSLENAGNAAKEKGMTVALYENFEDFFAHEMDAVVLANYANEHAPYAVRLLKSGRHVMSEVLTCATMQEAVELIEAVEESGKIYCYAENYCYFATTTEMRDRYQRGDIGELMQAECEYIHDCSSIWPQITYGERNHWRNLNSSVFYCTHSLGPILFSCGLRPVKVSGFETRQMDYMRALGHTSGTAGTLIVTLENGAIVKSVNGHLRRNPHVVTYQLYGDRGMMETDRFDGELLHVWKEGEKNCSGEREDYKPATKDERSVGAGHDGSDYFTTKYFLDWIKGDEQAKKNIIDVYTAVDMCIPGILGFRSIVEGGAPVEIPNLRNKHERDKYRFDTFCSFPQIAKDQYAPANAAQPNQEPIPDAAYEEVRRKWLAGEQG